MKPDIELVVGKNRFYIRSLNGRARDWIRDTFTNVYDLGNGSVLIGFDISYLRDTLAILKESKMEYE